VEIVRLAKWVVQLTTTVDLGSEDTGLINCMGVARRKIKQLDTRGNGGSSG
jgi:hypothetical protein